MKDVDEVQIECDVKKVTHNGEISMGYFESDEYGKLKMVLSKNGNGKEVLTAGEHEIEKFDIGGKMDYRTLEVVVICELRSDVEAVERQVAVVDGLAKRGKQIVPDVVKADVVKFWKVIGWGLGWRAWCRTIERVGQEFWK